MITLASPFIDNAKPSNRQLNPTRLVILMRRCSERGGVMTNVDVRDRAVVLWCGCVLDPESILPYKVMQLAQASHHAIQSSTAGRTGHSMRGLTQADLNPFSAVRV